jgi:hypothetical protein
VNATNAGPCPHIYRRQDLGAARGDRGARPVGRPSVHVCAMAARRPTDGGRDAVVFPICHQRGTGNVADAPAHGIELDLLLPGCRGTGKDGQLREDCAAGRIASESDIESRIASESVTWAHNMELLDGRGRGGEHAPTLRSPAAG